MNKNKKLPNPGGNGTPCRVIFKNILILVVSFSIPSFSGATALPAATDTSRFLPFKNKSSTPFSNETDAKSLINNLDQTKSQQKKIFRLIEQGRDDLSSGKKQAGLDKLKQAWELDYTIPVAGVLIAYTHIQSNDFKAALETAKQLQEKYPVAPEGYTLAGIAYAGLDDLKQAQAAFEKALEIRPGNTDANRNLAALYLKQDKTGKAEDVLNAALKLNPDIPENIINLANLQFKTKQTPKALALLESATSKHPNDLQLRIALAQLLLEDKQFTKVSAVFAEAYKQFPNDPELLQFIGVTHLQQGAADKALPFLESAAKIAPEIMSLHYNLALAYEQLNSIPQALAEIDQALQLEPNFESAKFVHAKLLAASGQLDSAAKLLKEIEQNYPDNPNIPELKGKIAIAQNKPDEAIAHFEAAVNKQEENPQLIADLALAQIQAKKMDAGFDTLRQWIKKHPDNIAARCILADTLLANQHHDEAQKYYAEVLELQPGRIDVRNNLAWSLAETGQLDKALDQAEKTAKLAPENPLVLDTLATILLKKDQTNNKAIDLLRKAVGISPADSAIAYHLAQAFSLTNKDEAKAVLKKLLSNNKPFKERASCEELLKTL